MKRIAVWGTEDAATKFLLTHKDIEVKYFIESKKMCRQFWGGQKNYNTKRTTERANGIYSCCFF